MVMSGGRKRGSVWWRGVLWGLLPLVLALPAHADIYRWVDDDGTVHYSNSPQPEASQRERRVFDSHGLMREIIPAPPTAEEREQARAEQEQAQQELEAARQARADQAARERQLRQAYENLDEIEELRARRVAAIGGDIARSEAQEITLLRERERIRRQYESSESASARARFEVQLEDLEARIDRERAYRRGQEDRLAAIQQRLDLDRDDYQRLVVNGEG
ncbi:DUF4124 domain-containing protein [Thioalkalivibrio sp. ALRh]|uniref:DUF4124 domain-containing protein n=1 Tax=Thioalkalivibrio sp. ALRh TaxID=1266911 RepID=UPI00056DC661|nr:DUF4124 domain-containing protein [Thioalkalivibrio sp. ALRh]